MTDGNFNIFVRFRKATKISDLLDMSFAFNLDWNEYVEVKGEILRKMIQFTEYLIHQK